MNTRRTFIQTSMLGALLLALPGLAQAQLLFTTNNGAITITGFTGSPSIVVIPSATNGYPVTSIAVGAFEFCGLTSVTISASVTSIGVSAFAFCFSLTSVTIPASVTSIGTSVFGSCSSLTSVTIPASVTSIGEQAFYYTDLTSVTIPNSVTSIGDEAFAGCGLTSLTIPASVTSIGNEAFSYCTGLRSVRIPSSVTTIGDGVFAASRMLTNIVVDISNPSYSSLNGVLFDKAQATLIEFPAGLGGSYIIANSVASIGNEAFYGCNSLTNVTIPASVTSIAYEAFVGCGLTSLTIPASVTSIGNDAFIFCPRLTNVTIPASITSIAYGAFASCTNLANVTIPTTVTNVGSDAFYNCPNLKAVYFQGNAPAPNYDSSVFQSDTNATVYYLPGTTGWGPIFDFRPTAVLLLQAQTGDGNFGVRNNQFGFNVTWAGGQTVVVEATTNLANPVWTPLATNALVSGTNYFSDPQWTNYPARYYRVRTP
jgi:BspA type Leucine rich repeat region (6 copies)